MPLIALPARLRSLAAPGRAASDECLPPRLIVAGAHAGKRRQKRPNAPYGLTHSAAVRHVRPPARICMLPHSHGPAITTASHQDPPEHHLIQLDEDRAA
jgi:hypothetical protein